MLSNFWKISIPLDIYPNRSASDGKSPGSSTSHSAVRCDLFLARGNRLVSAKGQKTQRRYATKDRAQQQQPVYAVPVGEVTPHRCPDQLPDSEKDGVQPHYRAAVRCIVLRHIRQVSQSSRHEATQNEQLDQKQAEHQIVK